MRLTAFSAFGWPMRSDMRADGRWLHIAHGLEAHEFAILRAIHVAVRDGPLFQILLVDGFDDEATPGLSEKAKLARLVAGKPLDRRGDERRSVSLRRPLPAGARAHDRRRQWPAHHNAL